MPKPIIYISLILIVLAMIPPALIARARTFKTDARRIHYIQDMDNQVRVRAQHASPVTPDGESLFADGRGMRRPVTGTVARGELFRDDHFSGGVVNNGWATSFPAETPLTRELLDRGRDRYAIYCTPCHGQAGYGDGIVHQRTFQLSINPAIGNGTTWVQPKNIHEPEIRIQPPGQVFNTITNGIRTMAGYESQIPIADRWAITAYVKALQRSQNAKPGDVPVRQLDSLPVQDLRTDLGSDQ